MRQPLNSSGERIASHCTLGLLFSMRCELDLSEPAVFLAVPQRFQNFKPVSGMGSTRHGYGAPTAIRLTPLRYDNILLYRGRTTTWIKTVLLCSLRATLVYSVYHAYGQQAVYSSFELKHFIQVYSNTFSTANVAPIVDQFSHPTNNGGARSRTKHNQFPTCSNRPPVTFGI